MFRTFARLTAPALLILSLAACGGGGSDAPPPVVTPPPTPTVTLTLSSPTVSVEAATSSSVTATIVRGGGFTGAVTIAASGAPTGVTVAPQTIDASSSTTTLAVVADASAAAGASALSITGSASGVSIAPATLALTVTAAPPPPPVGATPIGGDFARKAAGDNFGHSAALSADGTRVIFGAPTASTNGSQSGNARVYQRSGSAWVQVGADIDGEHAGDRSAQSVAMSNDGSRVAIGAWLNNDGATNRGHVRVFDLVAGVWTQIGADIDPPIGSSAGSAVALSASGHRVVIGAPGRISVTGYAFVYELVGGSWVQVGATIGISGSYELGTAVDISDDGNRIAVGVPGANTSDRQGSTYVYDWNGSAWVQLGATIVGETNGDNAGSAVSLSADGARIAIGAPANKDGGISGGGGGAGQVRVYELVAGVWTQLGGDIDGIAALNGDNLGTTLALSADGNRLIATAPSQSGAKIFSYAAGAWTQTGASIADGARALGVALSADGHTAAVGYINSGMARVYSVSP